MNFSLLICAGGLGSRLFPVTWAIPKELFPLSNRPALHYVLEEALAANISDVVFITSPRKEALVGYLTYSHESNNVVKVFEEKKRLDILDELNKKISYQFIIQEKPAGVGNAILKGKKAITKDYFFMAHPDDIMKNKQSGILQLKNVFNKYSCSVILVEKVPLEKIHLYGVIQYKNKLGDGLFSVEKIIEKPTIETAPSDYGVVGRYLLSTHVLQNLDNQNQESPCFISAMNDLITQGETILAVEVDCKRYDIGTVPGWLEAIRELN